MELDPHDWAHREFSECQLGDHRRTHRLIKSAAQVLSRPEGSTPDQTESWGDCKSLDRLMDCEDVNFDAITAPHYQRTRASGSSGRVRLIINDTTEINYGRQRRSRGLGLVGQNTGRGFFLHTALMRDPESEEVVGLGGPLGRKCDGRPGRNRFETPLLRSGHQSGFGIRHPGAFVRQCIHRRHAHSLRRSSSIDFMGQLSESLMRPQGLGPP